VHKYFYEAAGWYGAAAVIAGYCLVSFNLLPPDDLFYQTLNFSGAVGIVIVSFKNKTYQPGVLNLIWALIAVIAMARILF
jgi:hypothetical protein